MTRSTRLTVPTRPDEPDTEGLVVLDACEVIRYGGRDDTSGEPDAKGKRPL